METGFMNQHALLLTLCPLPLPIPLSRDVGHKSVQRAQKWEQGRLSSSQLRLGPYLIHMMSYRY